MFSTTIVDANVLLKPSNATSTTRSARYQPLRVVRAEAGASQTNSVGRRDALGLFAGLTSILGAQPAVAAYGEAGNVFGKTTNVSGFIPYSQDGFSLLIPSRWNPSDERDFPSVIFRYEDNGDNSTHCLVSKAKTDKSSMSDYGTPEEFLDSISNYFGQQSYSGQTQSEGGFAPDKVSSGSLLSFSTPTKEGKNFYNYEVFTRTADGDEGGRHILISSTVAGGNLFILKVEVGDKRWFKGMDKFATKLLDSFTVV